MSDPVQKRPAFMEALGLLPPYLPEDVEAAFRDKAKVAHPDRGGTMDAFLKLNEAYRLAREYVKFRAGRRQWLAAQVERYARQEEVIAVIEKLGGNVELDHYDWIKQSVGEDFATVAQRILQVKVNAPNCGTTIAKMIHEHLDLFDHITDLDLSGTGLTDDNLRLLEKLVTLYRVDLSRTNISSKSLAVIENWPQLSWLNVSKTRVGVITGMRLKWKYRSKRPTVKPEFS